MKKEIEFLLSRTILINNIRRMKKRREEELLEFEVFGIGDSCGGWKRSILLFKLTNQQKDELKMQISDHYRQMRMVGKVIRVGMEGRKNSHLQARFCIARAAIRRRGGHTLTPSKVITR